MHDKEVRKLTELEDTHWWYAERRHLLARTVAGMPPGRALDIGAAGGGNSRVLAAAGWSVMALEYGAEGAQIGKERGLDVLRADATALPIATDSLDLVVAYDVLEHIPDHDAAAAGRRMTSLWTMSAATPRQPSPICCGAMVFRSPTFGPGMCCFARRSSCVGAPAPEVTSKRSRVSSTPACARSLPPSATCPSNPCQA